MANATESNSFASSLGWPPVLRFGGLRSTLRLLDLLAQFQQFAVCGLKCSALFGQRAGYH